MLRAIIRAGIITAGIITAVKIKGFCGCLQNTAAPTAPAALSMGFLGFLLLEEGFKVEVWPVAVLQTEIGIRLLAESLQETLGIIAIPEHTLHAFDCVLPLELRLILQRTAHPCACFATAKVPKCELVLRLARRAH